MEFFLKDDGEAQRNIISPDPLSELQFVGTALTSSPFLLLRRCRNTWANHKGQISVFHRNNESTNLSSFDLGPKYAGLCQNVRMGRDVFEPWCRVPESRAKSSWRPQLTHLYTQQDSRHQWTVYGTRLKMPLDYTCGQKKGITLRVPLAWQDNILKY